jgi:hypothetical protein
MKDKEFDRLLSSAKLQLDELSKMVKETINAEEKMIDKVVTPAVSIPPPAQRAPVYITWQPRG